VLYPIYVMKQTSGKHRANVKQISSKHEAIRAHVVHMLHDVCLMFALSCKRGISMDMFAVFCHLQAFLSRLLSARAQ